MVCCFVILESFFLREMDMALINALFAYVTWSSLSGRVLGKGIVINYSTLDLTLE